MELSLEKQSDIDVACREWWLIDLELDALTARYSSVETELIQNFGKLDTARLDTHSVALLRSIDHQFERLDRRRATCREVLERLPAHTIQDAASKLEVAARLLHDEGGFEAIVVEEAVRLLAGLSSKSVGHRALRQGRREADHELAIAFHRNALSFLAAAAGIRSRTPRASEHYLSIAIELALKSYLLHLGVTDAWNRRHLRHDLAKALRFARRGGLQARSETLRSIVHRLGSHYQTRGFSRSSDILISADEWQVATVSVSELIRVVGGTLTGRAGATPRLSPP